MSKILREIEEVHYVAEQFLADYKATQAAEFTTAALEQERYVILLRDRSPEYFCGYTQNNKTAVWSRDIRYAKSFRESKAEAWIEYFSKDW